METKRILMDYHKSKIMLFFISLVVASSCSSPSSKNISSEHLSLELLMNISSLREKDKATVGTIIENVTPPLKYTSLENNQFAFISDNQDSLICNSSIQYYQILQYSFHDKSVFEELIMEVKNAKFKLTDDVVSNSGEHIMGFYKNGLTIIFQDKYSMANNEMGFRIIIRQTS